MYLVHPPGSAHGMDELC